MNMQRLHGFFGFALCALLGGCAMFSGAPPKGSQDAPPDEETAAMKAMGQKVKGTIVWSSSRLGNHDLFTMKTDGSEVKAITHGEEVDWFPRFSPDGSKILFCRSKKGWVSERDANDSDKWDIYTVNPDGSGIAKVVDSGSWASWIASDEIVFVRGIKIFRTKLGSKKETEIMSSEGVSDLDGALLQQPEMSPDGKYIAITLRGSKRETGIWDIAKKSWTSTGLGCQINWKPDGTGIYWVNPTGNGGSEIFSMPIKDGKPVKELSDDDMRLMDYPGRRSHEYFPEVSADGKWMVWGITQRGHDHDIADYEIYLWQVGTPPESGVRLTYHSANDRWPDIFIPGAAPQAAAAAPAVPAPTGPEPPQTASVPAAPAPAQPAPASAKTAPPPTKTVPAAAKAGRKHRAKK
jgi:Tol biopolymer transport system component